MSYVLQMSADSFRTTMYVRRFHLSARSISQTPDPEDAWSSFSEQAAGDLCRVVRDIVSEKNPAWAVRVVER